MKNFDSFYLVTYMLTSFSSFAIQPGKKLQILSVR